MLPRLLTPSFLLVLFLSTARALTRVPVFICGKGVLSWHALFFNTRAGVAGVR